MINRNKDLLNYIDLQIQFTVLCLMDTNFNLVNYMAKLLQNERDRRAPTFLFLFEEY